MNVVYYRPIGIEVQMVKICAKFQLLFVSYLFFVISFKECMINFYYGIKKYLTRI